MIYLISKHIEISVIDYWVLCSRWHSEQKQFTINKGWEIYRGLRIPYTARNQTMETIVILPSKLSHNTVQHSEMGLKQHALTHRVAVFFLHVKANWNTGLLLLWLKQACNYAELHQITSFYSQDTQSQVDLIFWWKKSSFGTTLFMLLMRIVHTYVSNPT